MTPKKITLSYTTEDGTTHSREYTDLSQVWHPASEPSLPYIEIIVEQYNRGDYSNDYWIEYLIPDEIYGFREHNDYRWTYITDLLPSASCSENPNNSSK